MITLSLLQRIRNTKCLLRSTCTDNLRVPCVMRAKICSAEWLPGLGSKCLSLFCTFLFFFFVCFDYFLLHFSSLSFFFFAFIFKISGPTASIFVNEKSCYLEHGTLRSNRGHYSSLDLRVFLCVQLTPLTQEGLGDPQVSCQTLRVCMSSWTPGLWR